MLIAREETESGGEIERFGQNGISAEIPPLACRTRSFKSFAQKMPQPLKRFCDGSKLAFVRHFVKCHINHVIRARALIG